MKAKGDASCASPSARATSFKARPGNDAKQREQWGLSSMLHSSRLVVEWNDAGTRKAHCEYVQCLSLEVDESEFCCPLELWLRLEGFGRG